MAAFLLDHGADPGTEYYRTTILTKPIEDNNVPMVRTLLSHGVPVDLHRKNKETALFSAIRQRCLPMVTVLLERGANTIFKNKKEETPIKIACDSYDNTYEEFSRIRQIKPPQIKVTLNHHHDYVYMPDPKWQEFIRSSHEKINESEEILDCILNHFFRHEAQRWLNESALFQSLRKKYYPQE